MPASGLAEVTRRVTEARAYAAEHRLVYVPCFRKGADGNFLTDLLDARAPAAEDSGARLKMAYW